MLRVRLQIRAFVATAESFSDFACGLANAFVANLPFEAGLAAAAAVIFVGLSVDAANDGAAIFFVWRAAASTCDADVAARACCRAVSAMLSAGLSVYAAVRTADFETRRTHAGAIHA